MRMTIVEASKYWKVTRKTIDRWVDDGKLEIEYLPSGRKLVVGVKKQEVKS